MPKELGNLINLTMFNVSDNSIGGELCPNIHVCNFDDISIFFTGELPKELGKLINLKYLGLSRNRFRGKSYVPAYMRCVFADDIFFLQENCPRSSDN